MITTRAPDGANNKRCIIPFCTLCQPDKFSSLPSVIGSIRLRRERRNWLTATLVNPSQSYPAIHNNICHVILPEIITMSWILGSPSYSSQYDGFHIHHHLESMPCHRLWSKPCMNAFEALAPGQVVVFLTTEQRFLQIIGSGTWARSARPIMMPIRARAPPSAPKHTTYKKLELNHWDKIFLFYRILPRTQPY